MQRQSTPFDEEQHGLDPQPNAAVQQADSSPETLLLQQDGRCQLQQARALAPADQRHDGS
jgi:hypothetical protein